MKKLRFYPFFKKSPKCGMLKSRNFIYNSVRKTDFKYIVSQDIPYINKN